MQINRKARLLLVPSLCLLLAACSLLPPQATATPAPVWTGTPTPSPEPTPSPTPSPTPVPTPTPSPTPTPDPWAAFFSPGGAYVKVDDQDKGPWVYKDETLGIRIELRKLGSKVYFWSEIHSRGPLPFGGFADLDPKGRKRALPYLIARQHSAVFGITGDYVTQNVNRKGVMIRQGTVFREKDDAPTMAVMPDGDLRVFEPGEITADELLAQGVKDSFAFGPILVKDGKVHPSVKGHRLRRHNWRASIGQIEPGHYIVIVNHVGMDLMDLAGLYVENGCTVAYNMDGGHSSTIVFMGEQLYKQAPGEDNGEQRSLTDLLMIGMNPAVPGPKDPVYCNGLSKNKKYRPAPTDGPLQ